MCVYIYMHKTKRVHFGGPKSARGGIFLVFFLYIVLFRHHVSACVPTHTTPKADTRIMLYLYT